MTTLRWREFRTTAPWLLLAATLIYFLSSCAAMKPYEATPIYQPEPSIVSEPAAPATSYMQESKSVHENGSISLAYDSIADVKAHKVGSIVQVRVVQSSQGTQSGATDSERSSSIGARITRLFGLEEAINKLVDFDSDDNPGAQPPNLIETNSTSSFAGSASTTRQDNLTATVSAVVTKVLPNGYFVIDGSQVVQLNHEASVLRVRGIIRPSDIGPDNSLESTRIADARIEFNGQGVVSEKQRPGWGTRVFDRLWPF